MSDVERTPLSPQELAAEGATALPDKEVVSLLDLNADLDLGLDVAAPIDLAVAANANVAAPIDAAVGANVLSVDSTAQSLADQNVAIHQGIDADATATATQDSGLDQSNDTVDPGTTTDTTAGTAPTTGDATTTVTQPDPSTAGSALDGDLLNIDVKAHADTDLAAPINGAVAANANVAAPIDAAVSANVGSFGSEATAVAQQDATIDQTIDGAATASGGQTSDITQ